jgi:hypothetical protein
MLRSVPHPLDEFPIHQAPLSIAHPVSSDKNVYDRCYLNAHDRTGDVFAITGLGVYSNLGVIDAYFGVRSGDRQVTIRASDALGDGDRMQQQVGPYRLEVVKPLEELRITVDAPDLGVEADIRWQGSFPAVDEQPHVWRQGARITLDACRYAQVGTWEGTIRVDDETWELGRDTWVGTRDRSWGIRPVGEPDPPGRTAAETPPDYGFWWTYVPMRFDDFGLLFIAQEDGQGHRLLNDACRIFPDGRVEQLGWPRYEIHYDAGTRRATGATITATAEDGEPLVFEVRSKGFIGLSTGLGYGGDPEWNHGRWMGRGHVARVEHDYAAMAAQGGGDPFAFSMLDHVGVATCDGQEGHGLFEHMSLGAHAPSGFTDFGSVAG